MKTRVLRNAISIALLAMAAGIPDAAMAQEAAAGTEEVPEDGAGKRPAGSPPSRSSSRKGAAATDLKAVTVTGSRIRGGAAPSPTVIIGAEAIREEGFADLGEVIRGLPQNAGGGQNPGVAAGATAGVGGLANQNVTGGSSLNLRGLGPDASLTLLNGRRMAYGSFVQSVDISAIPVEAVERVEIVADGASAIHGSDAVGGVANVILMRDYDGVNAGVRYGAATQGGLATREYTLTAGTTWATGGLIATHLNTDNDGLYARQRDYTARMFDPSTLYPDTDLESTLVSMHQSLGDAVELKLDALRTVRHMLTFPNNGGLGATYFMNTTRTETASISPGIEVSLPRDWMLQLGANWGRDRTNYRQFDIDILNGGSALWNYQCFCNETRAYDIGVEGPVFTLPGGEARLAAGGGYRKNAFLQRNHLANMTAIQGEESSRFVYAEVNLPFVGRDAGIPGVHRLELNLAARSEHYDSFGRVTTPKVGLIYSPSADFTVKGSWGKSFKTPTLLQRYWMRSASLSPPAYYGGIGYPPEATVLALYGGNPDLGPERARTWSASLAFHPEALPALQAEVTWFDIDYTDRVVEPITNFGRAMGNPVYDRFISYRPSHQEQAELIALADTFWNLAGVPYDPDQVAAILYDNYANVARQHIKGLDLSISYRFDVGAGRLTLRGSGSWLDSAQQTSEMSPWHDIAGSLFSPAKINARAGAVWSQGGLSASAFVNYTGGVTNRLVQGSTEKTSAFTTVDTTLRYEPDSTGIWRGMAVAFSVQNLLDRDPPFYTPLGPADPPYDSTNYSAIGRFMSLSVSKRF
ncbi:TonB-dependent receptor plug domain-containing protein [Stenotrophomonas mori]|uniref:TonB-dependent receptor n=1 Tax=Stenotrophomonas mori TaxID=2871096 RepID=A0ABT0SI02_9GAMM|nr:TonB-dependent receptor [Stenotrophomonas mori]MCL7714972.1 TonB-dependent receptor [Stenotrophomonas mori]